MSYGRSLVLFLISMDKKNVETKTKKNKFNRYENEQKK